MALKGEIYGKNLTALEVTRLKLKASGHSQAEIARLASISRNAVKNQMCTIREKLGANDTAHAVAIAIGKGLI